MAAWRKEEVGAARHRQEKREATTGKVIITHGTVEFCGATLFWASQRTKESLYGRGTERDLHSACRSVTQLFFFFSERAAWGCLCSI